MTITPVHGSEVCTPSSNSDNGLAEVLSNGIYGQILRAFDKLQLGEDSTLQLPKIVVVGNESVGKSSTIERIADFKIFPTGEGFTTRMVTKLMLRHSVETEEVIIRIVNRKSGEVISDENGDKFEACVAIGDDYKNTEDIIRSHINKNIEKFTAGPECTKNTQDVDTDHEFQVEVRSARVATLDLYDMPGIVSDPPVIAQNTRKLTREQMTDPNVVVICVLSMTTNLRNSIVLTEIREANKVRGPKMRAIGVLTHVDLSTPDRVERSIGNFLPDSPLNSLIPMINNDTNPINGHRSVVSEGDFTDAGVSALVRQVDSQLRGYMREYWLQNQLDRLSTYHNVVIAKIEALGEVANTEVVKNGIILDVQRVLVAHISSNLAKINLNSDTFSESFTPDRGMPAFSSKPQGLINRIKFQVYWKRRIRESMKPLIQVLKEKVLSSVTSGGLMPVLFTCKSGFAVSRFSAMPTYLSEYLLKLFQKDWSTEDAVFSAVEALIENYVAPGTYTLQSHFLPALTEIILEHFFIPVLIWCESEKFMVELINAPDLWKDDNDAKRLEYIEELKNISNAQDVMRSLEE